MHPLLTQELARQRREELLRAATLGYAAFLIEQENSKSFKLFGLLKPLQDRSKLLSGRPVIIHRQKYSDIDFDDIKHELQVTFAAIRKVDSECDDHFIEVFMQKLRNSLPSAGELLLVKMPTFSQRLLLAIIVAGILVPLVGMVIGISQGILLGVSLLCLLVAAVGILLSTI